MHSIVWTLAPAEYLPGRAVTRRCDEIDRRFLNGYAPAGRPRAGVELNARSLDGYPSWLYYSYMNGKRAPLRKGVPPRDTGQVMRALVGAAHAVEDRWEEALARVELSGPKFGALTVLTQAGEPLSLGELAARLTCVRSNITQLVDRLEADGLVRRVEDPADRRGKRAAVTPLGVARQSAGARQVEKVQKELGKTLAGLDHAALERVRSALT